MISGIRFGSLILAVSMVVACSDDDGVGRPTTAKPPSTSKPANSSVESPSSGPRLRGEPQTSDSLPKPGFAGFGRVGRSLFSDVDYRARWAVIVGVNRFKKGGLSRLDNAVNDAHAVRNMLRDEFGYDQDRIIYLVDQDKDASGFLTDKEPITKKRMVEAFEELALKDIRSSDAVLFFFAGHGKSDGKGTFLAAYDSDKDDLSTWVNAGVLKEKLANLSARHKLMILDSCYAGSLLQVDLSKVQSSTNSPAELPEPTEPTKPASSKQSAEGARPIRNRGDEAMELRDSLDYYLQEPAFLAITSGRNQPVGDASFATPEHSPFTTAFLQILEERANSSRPGDVFTARELAVRVESQVRASQTPDWGRLGRGRGDFIFTPTRDRLTPRETAERDDYFIHINLAQIAAERGNWGRALFVLDRCDEKQRHFEWYRLRTLADDSEIVWRGHQGPVRAVVVSADGKFVLAGGDDGTIRLWDFSKPGAPLASWMAHAGGVTALAISPDQGTIVSGGVDKTVKIWDTTSRDNFLNPTVKTNLEPVRAVAIGPGGKDIAFSIAGFDSTRGELHLLRPSKDGILEGVFSKSEMMITTLAFSPDGTQIVSGSRKISGFDGEIKLWDINTGKQHPTRLNRVTENMSAGCVAWSSDGRHIAAGNRDGTVTIWDAKRGGAPLKTIKAHVGGVGSIAFSPDGKRILSCKEQSIGIMLASDRTVEPETVPWIKVWDVDHVDGNAPLLVLERHQKLMTSLTFGPNGKHIVSGSLDGTVRKWPTEPFEKTITLAAHDHHIFAIAMSTDGKRIVSTAANPVRQMTAEMKIWDAESGKVLWTSPKQKKTVHSVAVSPDGKHIASGSGDFLPGVGEIKLWNADTFVEPVWTFATRESEQVTSVAFSANGKLMAAGTKRWTQNFSALLGTLYIWDLGDPKSPVRQFESQQGGIETVTFSPDSRRVVFGGSNKQYGAVEILDIESGKRSMPLPQLKNNDRVGNLVFNPFNKHLVARNFVGDISNEVRIWDLQRVSQPLHIFNTAANSMAITSDGKRLITGSNTTEGVQVWDAIRGGEALLTLREGRSPVTVTPDGKRIVSASVDGKSIVIWNTKHWPQ